ncbi:response regulator transcription factor [Acetobacterium wieringae]|uniref:response regulator transcription factor n=1 Tax=Acetobacterium wieringae TaxID=52694 RepID=UPI0020342ADD|nr:response regulator transcription factor [Acetobacterium wieringae]URN84859.1 response regulator transcription factor [Acetobacterium wieringae]
MYKILIIEDDQIIANALKNHLEKWGLEAVTIDDFHYILDEFVTYDPQLVLLDISLPFFNGYHWCSEIRKISKVPIIFISSTSDNMNIVMAMNMGGDDFIAKPFDLTVVVAKIQALLRQNLLLSGSVNLLEHKGTILNLGDASLSYADQKVELSKNEFKTLQILLENKGEVVSRDVIMKRLWDSDCFVDDNTLTVNIARLRKKLDEAGLSDFIATKKGVGYLIGD